MTRKWIGFAVVATLVAASGFASRLSLAQDQEKHKENETPLGKIMHEVQQCKLAINKGVRNPASFKKAQKDVEKSSVELVKLAKKSKPLKETYLKNAKNESDPKKKWDEIMDAFIKASEDLSASATKTGAEQKKVKDAFQLVNKTCTDCHTVFRVDESSF